MKTYEQWFGVDSEGWRRVNAGRSMGHLIREAVSNVFDMRGVSEASLTVKPGYVRIEDDCSKGFGDSKLISTIFMTDKEDSCLKRGRKGRGLKELISAADRAKVETVGFTVSFGSDGRVEEDNSRERGTVVEIHSSLESWNDPKEVSRAVRYLKRVISPSLIRYRVNGVVVARPARMGDFRVELPTTVIHDGIEKTIHTEAVVSLLDAKGKYGWVHEMGIPIQKTSCPYHVDVAQRVPMNDNRDMVSDNYLNRLFSKVLNFKLSDMSPGQLKAKWVVNCVGYLGYTGQQAFAKRLIGGGSSRAKVVSSTTSCPGRVTG